MPTPAGVRRSRRQLCRGIPPHSGSGSGWQPSARPWQREPAAGLGAGARCCTGALRLPAGSVALVVAAEQHEPPTQSESRRRHGAALTPSHGLPALPAAPGGTGRPGAASHGERLPQCMPVHVVLTAGHAVPGTRQAQASATVSSW
eukprot:1193306-Rhodomonas_salina.1